MTDKPHDFTPSVVDVLIHEVSYADYLEIRKRMNKKGHHVQAFQKGYNKQSNEIDK